MPITLLDIVLIVVMLVSGLLAMVRGFMREVLSITAWLLAAANFIAGMSLAVAINIEFKPHADKR